jgi:serine protease AprX
MLDRGQLRLDRVQLERWLYGHGPRRRRTQDSPVMPDVWFAYALPETELDPFLREEVPLLEPSVDSAFEDVPVAPVVAGQRVDLLLRPHYDAGATALIDALAGRLGDSAEAALLAKNDVYVAARLTFAELLRDALPLSRWWQHFLWEGEPLPLDELVASRWSEFENALLGEGPLVQGRRTTSESDLPGDLVWFVGLVGRIGWEAEESTQASGRTLPTAEEVLSAASRILAGVLLGRQPEGTPLWAVSRNRRVRSTVWLSRQAVKADAATTLFGLSCREIRWAVIDSGIDARHPAFADRSADADTAPAPPLVDQPGPRSRVFASYDFSDLRTHLAGPSGTGAAGPSAIRLDDPGASRADAFGHAVREGRAVDWDTVSGQLLIPHTAEDYVPPVGEHGTHVAGILGGDWRPTDDPSPGDQEVQGMCPDIGLYDLRVFRSDGTGDEFSILSAMQFVRHLNATAERPVIHGVNLSFAVRHEVAKYAAGRTPVCDEADRLVASGVVVVAAAGNEGRGGYIVRNHVVEGYRTVSIADPGNAEEAITVGATHRSQPHTYGVSYFSSRGPTGDGRAKPDLVAPGEKITAPVPDGGLKTLDGTSQAAPHVSGAAALLLARYPELIGRPRRVKQILCKTATDLERERDFQGAGMLDTLRALQSV